jgi:hypothetical protein
METFLGFHAEWNLGSPGGFDYQRITQELGKLCFTRVQEYVDLNFELDFDHPLLYPVAGLAGMLLRAHQRNFPGESPYIVLIAEPDTLETVVENINFVAHLNSLDGVQAHLASPEEIEDVSGEPRHRGKKVSVIFQDFNTDTLLKLGESLDISGVTAAIRSGVLVNPRGMEPVGAKGVFEAITGKFRDQLSRSTVARTPWTRRFFPRSTTGPKGEDIHDLIEWTRDNLDRLILKPEHGYSGMGIHIGYKTADPDAAIAEALGKGNYIVQALVPLDLWAEDSPWLDDDGQSVILKRWQTDYRCLVTDSGLIGFLGRFGSVPTNVGSGGGTQPLAVLKDRADVGEAVAALNRAIAKIPYSTLKEIKDEVDQKAVEMGHTYLLGPIPTALRPRLLNPAQMGELKSYCENVWHDCVFLEKVWREGGLNEMLNISPEEMDLALAQPWNGGPALMATDGLFSFGGHPDGG